MTTETKAANQTVTAVRNLDIVAQYDAGSGVVECSYDRTVKSGRGASAVETVETVTLTATLGKGCRVHSADDMATLCRILDAVAVHRTTMIADADAPFKARVKLYRDALTGAVDKARSGDVSELCALGDEPKRTKPESDAVKLAKSTHDETVSAIVGDDPTALANRGNWSQHAQYMVPTRNGAIKGCAAVLSKYRPGCLA